jgi:hypothetical protein
VKIKYTQRPIESPRRKLAKVPRDEFCTVMKYIADPEKIPATQYILL